MPHYLPEPAFAHGKAAKTAVLLINLGTPDAPTPTALRRYLKEFLSDPRVVEIPRLVWWPILNGIILNTRPRKSAAKYASIWTPEGSPLKVHTERQAQALATQLSAAGLDVTVTWAMRYGQPAVGDVLSQLRAQGCTRILLCPLYPQYAASTSATALDAAFGWLQQSRFQPEVRSIQSFHDDPGYIAALADSVRQHWQAHGPLGEQDRLIMSFHGLPRRSLDLGDPYFCHCHKTGRLLAESLGLTTQQYQICFQSRFGKAEWLQPYTAPTLHALGQAGVRRVDILCPGFVGDCLETLEEIAMEGKADFLAAGGQQYHYIPCLNENPAWVDALGQLITRHLAGWPVIPDGNEASELAGSRARASQLGAQH